MTLPLGIADIEAAAERLAGFAVRTPLLSSGVLDDRVGSRVLLKAECLQRTGSFKFRGAWNRLSLIPEADRAHGVVACSSGNHAQGVAEAARILGMAATIVMPHDAPAIKRDRTLRSGATVIGYDRERDDRDVIAAGIVDRTGATFVHPYDDPGVMAGQGTVGLEIAEDLAAQGLVADRVLVPGSGGGLLAGIATAIAAQMPDARCLPVEPAGFDDISRSIVAGTRLANASRTGTLADSLMANTPGRLTFEIHRVLARPGYAVPDDALLNAMAFAFAELKLVVEPGGAAGLAAVLSGMVPAGGTMVVVLSGGNVEPATFARAIAA